MNYKNKFLGLLLFSAMLAMSCNKTDDPQPQPMLPDFSGTYIQADQMGRPAVNTVFVTPSSSIPPLF